jgi:amidase
MIRREFIRTSIYTLAIGVPGFSLLQSCARDKSETAVPTSTPVGAGFTLDELTIGELQEKMKNSELTARSIAEAYLSRIEAIDKAGPRLNSIIELNPDALAIADKLDEERKSNRVRGPLHGIPVLIKDNINTGDKMMTTAGSLALSEHHPGADAFIVTQLREAGAIILGKTNLSEWANFRASRSSSGWSSRGGQTLNPYVLDRSPCGSSSGSGTAVAANLCAIAIGTETDGSIACPASVNGIVGIKPTVGLWSRSGIIPISESQDTAGPMARTVTDAATLLGALTRIDPDDKAMADRKESVPTDYTTFLDANALKGKVVGIDKALLKGHEVIDVLLEKAIEQMKGAGATVVPVDFKSKFGELGKSEYERLLYEFKDGLNRYLQKYNAPIKTLAELIEFNKKNADRVMPFFRQEIFEEAEAKGGVASPEYQKLTKQINTIARTAFQEVFSANKLDAVCGPANGPGWCIDLVNGDFFTGYGMYSPAAIAGYPSVTVPLGFVNGLPIGISFLGEAYSEGKLISIAFAYEQLSKNRANPEFLQGKVGYPV